MKKLKVGFTGKNGVKIKDLDLDKMEMSIFTRKGKEKVELNLNDDKVLKRMIILGKKINKRGI